MKWVNIVAEAFNKPTSNRVRLIVSLLFIMFATAILMSIFQMAKGIVDPHLTVYESQLYTIVFISITAPIIALFILLKFDNLYKRANTELQERKRTEEALNKNLAMLAKSQEIAHLGSWSVDFKTRKFEVSDEIYRIYGLEPGTVEPTLDLSAKLTHPDDLERYREYDESMQREGQLGSIDYRIVRPDGSVRYVHAQTDSIVRGPEGMVMMASGVTQDINERKRAEEALQSSEAKFRALFEGAGVAIFVADVATGRIMDCNGKAEELIGKRRVEIIGLHQTQLHPVDQAEVQREQFARHTNGIILDNDEALVQHRDGRVIPVIINAAPLKVNGQDIMIGFFLDITGRKQTEKALRASETRFRALIQNSSDIIRIIGRDGRIVYDSPSSEKILGYPPGTTIGKSPLDFIHPDDREKARNDLEEVLEKRNPGEPTGFRIRKADGSYLDVESIGVNLIGTPGVDGLVINTRPITERKRAEEDLKKAKEQAELYLDLMGHDINNLHQIAMGYLEFAMEMAGQESGQREFLDKPFEVLRRGARLIDNVRKLQKLSEGAYAKGPVDVRTVLANAIREYRDMPGKTISVDYLGNSDCRIIANDLLSDVFSNLIDNAIKHVRDNPDISVSLEKVRENGRDHYRVAVEDNGPGIPDSMKGKIFNRLLEGDSHSRGMGLGLYMVKSLVGSYDGRVWVEDRIAGDHARGARFVVMLPAAD